MEELYIEDFYKKVQRENAPASIPNREPTVTSLAETNDPHLQIKFYLDQLETTMAQEFKNFADFRFIFAKIKTSLKEENTLGIYLLLNDLEELMDVS